jgi:membrane protease YdiL (CAAX protease family)
MMPLFLALLALAWARATMKPLRDFGFVRPRSWLLTILAGVIGGVALKFFVKAVAMPLLGAPPTNETYHYLAGNTAALPGAILTFLLVAGFGEETFFRGFLFDRLRKLLGEGVVQTALIVVITTALFASAHYADQKLPGVEQATFTGLAFGIAFAITGQIWGVMIAHAFYDLTALAMIYWNAEPAIAHSIFK